MNNDSHRFKVGEFECVSISDGGHKYPLKNFFANVGLNPGDDWQMGVVLNYLQGKFGVPPSTIDDPSDVFANRPKFERVEDFEGLSGQLSVSHDLAGPLGMRGWVFMNRLDEQKNRYDDSSYDSMDDSTVKGTFTADSTTRIKGGTLATCNGTAYWLDDDGTQTALSRLPKKRLVEMLVNEAHLIAQLRDGLAACYLEAGGNGHK